MQTSKIRPGLLVALKTTVSGGVHYTRTDLECDNNRAKWETLRVIDDPEEHERATKARNSAIAEIRKVCAVTSFGLICPLDRESDLDLAVYRARDIVDDYNNQANFSRVEIYILKGMIANSDVEAAQAITREVSQLMAEMTEGIDKLNAEDIRKAALKAQSISALVTEDQRDLVDSAIAQARKAAREIVKRIEKKGENAAFVLSSLQRGDLERARIAFLDLDDNSAPVETVTAPELSQRVADLDLGDTESPVETPETENNSRDTETMQSVTFDSLTRKAS